MQLSWDYWQGFNYLQDVFNIREGVQWGQRIGSLYLAASNLVCSVVWEAIVIDKFVRRWVESRESDDRKKLEVRVGKAAGVITNEMDVGEKAKRNYLQRFGMITGILRKDPIGAG
ncbi:hypothetical protein HDU99_009895, partial [Rhizoclosmatium hyalinum]